MMKTQRILLILALLAFTIPTFAQKSLPSVDVKTLDGQTVNIQDIVKEHDIVILSFWATWCKPCKLEMDAFLDFYDEWKEDYGVEVVAVTIDTQRAMPKVKPMVETKGWPFVFLADPKQDLKNALNFQAIPQTFMLIANGEIVYEHAGYLPGDEYELEKKVQEVAEKK